MRLAQVDPGLPGVRLQHAVDVEPAPPVVAGVEARDALVERFDIEPYSDLSAK